MRAWGAWGGLAVWLLGMLAVPAGLAVEEVPPPMIVVDWPSDGTVVPSRLVMTGWAVAEGVERGTGVDALRAYLDGPMGSGTLFAHAEYGVTRADVALARGEGRYAPSGWRIDADLPPGPRTVYLYAHLATAPAEEGWVGPVQVSVTVGGGAARELGFSPAGSAAGCGGPDAVPGRCAPAPGAPTADCLVSDPDSGRCMQRPAGIMRADAPGVGAVPGSWTAAQAAESGAGGSMNLAAAGGARGASAASIANSGNAAGSAAAPASLTPSGRAAPPAMSLTAATARGRHVQLHWNQMSVGGPVAYEVRRCPAGGSGTVTCEVVATVQGGGHRLLNADGVYLVRAIGPQGQLHGESNRLYICCGGMATLWQ
jgi:hypothetical protein